MDDLRQALRKLDQRVEALDRTVSKAVYFASGVIGVIAVASALLLIFTALFDVTITLKGAAPAVMQHGEAPVLR